jgi:WD40 repeat protein
VSGGLGNIVSSSSGAAAGPKPHASGQAGLRDTLVTASWDGTARITDITRIDSDPWNIADTAVATFVSDGNSLVVASDKGVIKLSDVRSKQPYGDAMIDEEGAIKIAMSSNGRRLATVSGYFGSLEKSWSGHLWDFSTRTRIGNPMKPATGSITLIFHRMANCCFFRA